MDDKFYLLDLNKVYDDHITTINNDIKFISSDVSVPVNNPLATHYEPFSNHLPTLHCALNKQSTSTHPPLNKTATAKYFGMLFCIIDLAVVYLFSGGYMYVIVCPSHKMIIISFKWTQILLIITLPTTKQLQYWWLVVCNMIELEILWNYNELYWFTPIRCSGISFNTTTS